MSDPARSTALQRVDTDPPAPIPLGASQTGAVALRTLDDVSRIAGAFARSGMFADVQDASQAVVKILAGAEMGFSPIASMNGVYIVKGRVSMGAGLIAAAIKRHPRYDFRIREHTDRICRIEFFEVDPRTGAKDPLGEASFSAEDAKRAGTQNMGKFPRNMLYARALTNGARWHTPDVFGGPVYTPDELGQAVDDEGVPTGIEPAEVVEEKPVSRVHRQQERLGRHPSEALYAGPTEEEAEAARQAKRPRPKPEPAPAPLLDQARDRAPSQEEIVAEVLAALEAVEEAHAGGDPPDVCLEPIELLVTTSRGWPPAAADFARRCGRAVCRGQEPREAIAAVVAEVKAEKASAASA